MAPFLLAYLCLQALCVQLVRIESVDVAAGGVVQTEGKEFVVDIVV